MFLTFFCIDRQVKLHGIEFEWQAFGVGFFNLYFKLVLVFAFIVSCPVRSISARDCFSSIYSLMNQLEPLAFKSPNFK